MKRVITVLLAVLLVLSLAACGSGVETKKLAGTWTCTIDVTDRMNAAAEQALGLSAADGTAQMPLQLVLTVTEDGAYTLRYDSDAARTALDAYATALHPAAVESVYAAAEEQGLSREEYDAAMEKAGITAAHCASVGIGSPGTCDSANGVVVRAYNLGWFNVPVCSMVTARLGLPCHLSNDANCAALAETVAGGAVGCRNMILITLGTGVGGGIVADGQLLEGVGGTGAEVGHTVLVLDGEDCTCGRKGCWEAYASATALIRQGKRAAAAQPESLLAGYGEGLTGKDVFDAAAAGDAAAQAVVDRYCVYVAAGITDLVNILGPEKVLIGGGISRQGERLLAPIRAYVAANCFGGHDRTPPVIECARLGNEAGIIGAAAL